MWTHRCTAEVNGIQCPNVSTVATWCFGYADDKFDRATWIETCEECSWDCHSIVSILDISHYTKGNK